MCVYCENTLTTSMQNGLAFSPVLDPFRRVMCAKSPLSLTTPAAATDRPTTSVRKAVSRRNVQGYVFDLCLYVGGRSIDFEQS